MQQSWLTSAMLNTLASNVSSTTIGAESSRSEEASRFSLSRLNPVEHAAVTKLGSSVPQRARAIEVLAEKARVLSEQSERMLLALEDPVYQQNHRAGSLQQHEGPDASELHACHDTSRMRQELFETTNEIN